MTFAELLRPKGAGLTTSAELAVAADRAEVVGRAAGERLTALTAQRSAALLADDESRLDQVELELTRVQRDGDRADLAAAELRRRHGEALAAERRAERDAIHARAEAAQRKGVELIRARYPKLAQPLAALAEELWGLEGEIEALNEALRKAGDNRQVLSVERARRPPEHAPAGYLPCQFLLDLTLPSADGSTAYVYAPPGHFPSLAGVSREGAPFLSGQPAAPERSPAVTDIPGPGQAG